MKILIVMDCFRYGGLSKMMNWLTSFLTESGHDVTLCSAYHSDYTSRLSQNIKFVSLEVKESTSKIKRNTIILIQKCKRYHEMLKNKYDLVLSVGDPCIYFVLFFRNFFKYKVVVTERVDPYHSRGLGDKIRRRLYGKCDGFVFQTEGAKNFFSSRIQERAVVIPNPVVVKGEIQKWEYNNADDSVVFVGRYDPYQKRTDILFQVFCEVLKKYPNLYLEVYGGGYENDTVKEMCEKLNISSNVHFNGVTQDVCSKLIKSKVFLFTSDFEGIPNTVIEAMMVGIPIVATDCSPGGVRMLLENGKYGYIAECGDFKTLAEKVCYVLENAEESSIKATAARNSLGRYEENYIGKKWERYFLTLFDKRGEERCK